ncbi:hypothetical protein ACCO45_008561 [Purpureocillium lilacinum]|uniref:Uncharacterized protein n=1 Tax=Purpureocillium lilacinum TaxID=33203 RepID=A0ACC4DRR4_PURLI
MQLTIAKAVTSITLLLLPGVMALPANPLGNILGQHLTLPLQEEEGPLFNVGNRNGSPQAHVAIDNGLNPADAPSHGSPLLDGILSAVAPAQAGKPARPSLPYGTPDDVDPHARGFPALEDLGKGILID